MKGHPKLGFVVTTRRMQVLSFLRDVGKAHTNEIKKAVSECAGALPMDGAVIRLMARNGLIEKVKNKGRRTCATWAITEFGMEIANSRCKKAEDRRPYNITQRMLDALSCLDRMEESGTFDIAREIMPGERFSTGKTLQIMVELQRRKFVVGSGGWVNGSRKGATPKTWKISDSGREILRSGFSPNKNRVHITETMLEIIQTIGDREMTTKELADAFLGSPESDASNYIWQCLSKMRDYGIFDSTPVSSGYGRGHELSWRLTDEGKRFLV